MMFSMVLSKRKTDWFVKLHANRSLFYAFLCLMHVIKQTLNILQQYCWMLMSPLYKDFSLSVWNPTVLRAGVTMHLYTAAEKRPTESIISSHQIRPSNSWLLAGYQIYCVLYFIVRSLWCCYVLFYAINQLFESRASLKIKFTKY